MTSKRKRLTSKQRDALLLWTAYRKRIRKPSAWVVQAAVDAYVKYAKPDTDDVAAVQAAMDAYCNQLWNRLNAGQRRAWLIKATP